VKNKPSSGRPCIIVTPRNEKRLDQLIRAKWLITTRELFTELNIGFSALKTMARTMKQWAISAGTHVYERGMQALVHCWRKFIANVVTMSKIIVL
jgi:hypothetical protein